MNKIQMTVVVQVDVAKILWAFVVFILTLLS